MGIETQMQYPQTNQFLLPIFCGLIWKKLKDGGNFKHEINFGRVIQYFKVTCVYYHFLRRPHLHPTSLEKSEFLLL